jgi:hypothetical protein
MNKSRITLCILLVIYLFAGLWSCTKKKGPDTPYGKMQGKWKLVRVATDNGGGSLVYAPVPKEQDWQWVFNGDGTGYDVENYNVPGITENFSWRIVNGDSLWIGTTTHDTTLYYIANLSAEQLTITKRDSTSTGNKVYEGLDFAKQ